MSSTRVSKYLRIIKKHYPHVARDQIRMLPRGNDHMVFSVNEEVTFRFSLVPREISPVRKEFLDIFSQKSPVLVPTITIQFDPDTNSYYEINTFIPGVSFYPSIARSWEKQDALLIAHAFGVFLTTLHSFSLDKARALGIGEMDPRYFWEYMQLNDNAYPKLKRLVFPHINLQEQVWIEKLFTDYIFLIRQTPFQTRVTHADMWVFHIIVDPIKHTLAGVIDFGPRIADPANDFKACEHYGREFVDAVYSQYKLAKDPTFDARRLFYTGHDVVFELARAIERKEKRNIEKYQQTLTEYIKMHPAIA